MSSEYGHVDDYGELHLDRGPYIPVRNEAAEIDWYHPRGPAAGPGDWWYDERKLVEPRNYVNRDVADPRRARRFPDDHLPRMEWVPEAALQGANGDRDLDDVDTDEPDDDGDRRRLYGPPHHLWAPLGEDDIDALLAEAGPAGIVDDDDDGEFDHPVPEFAWPAGMGGGPPDGGGPPGGGHDGGDDGAGAPPRDSIWKRAFPWLATAAAVKLLDYLGDLRGPPQRARRQPGQKWDEELDEPYGTAYTDEERDAARADYEAKHLEWLELMEAREAEEGRRAPVN